MRPPGKRSVYGLTFDWVQVVGKESTSNGPASPVVYGSLGSPSEPLRVAGGTYEIKIDIRAQVTNSNASVWVELLVNGASGELGPVAEPIELVNFDVVRSTASVITLPPIDIWLDFTFAKLVGAGSVSITFLYMRLLRVE